MRRSNVSAIAFPLASAVISALFPTGALAGEQSGVPGTAFEYTRAIVQHGEYSYDACTLAVRTADGRIVSRTFLGETISSAACEGFDLDESRTFAVFGDADGSVVCKQVNAFGSPIAPAAPKVCKL